MLECDLCGYRTEVRYQYTRHCRTKKHRRAVERAERAEGGSADGVGGGAGGGRRWECGVCGKSYKHASGLSRHRRTCSGRPGEKKEPQAELLPTASGIADSVVPPKAAPTASGIAPTASGIAPTASGIAPTASGIAPTASGIAPTASGIAPTASGIAGIAELPADGDVRSLERLVAELIRSNQEFKKEVLALAQQPRQVIHNDNRRQTYIENFLHVECRDAVDLSQLVNELPITVEDLVHMSEEGFERSVRRVFIQRLRNMAPTARPIHCTDRKRRTLYVKDRGEWNKDTDHRTIRRTIKSLHRREMEGVVDYTDRVAASGAGMSDGEFVQKNNMIIQLAGVDARTTERVIRDIAEATHV
jgi:hypothetical protein